MLAEFPLATTPVAPSGFSSSAKREQQALASRTTDPTRVRMASSFQIRSAAVATGNLRLEAVIYGMFGDRLKLTQSGPFQRSG